MPEIPESFSQFTPPQRKLLALLLEMAVETAKDYTPDAMPVGFSLHPDSLISQWMLGENNCEVKPLLRWRLVETGDTIYDETPDTGYRLTPEGVKIARRLHALVTTDPIKEPVTYSGIEAEIQFIVDGLIESARKRIADLKKSWLKDPCWDIEKTEGFEPYLDELKAYREEIEAEKTAAYEAAEAAKTIKTLVQQIAENGANVSERADRELQQHIEKGWAIKQIDHLTYCDSGGDWPVHVIKRIVMLTRPSPRAMPFGAIVNTPRQGL